MKLRTAANRIVEIQMEKYELTRDEAISLYMSNPYYFVKMTIVFAILKVLKKWLNKKIVNMKERSYIKDDQYRTLGIL